MSKDQLSWDQLFSDTNAATPAKAPEAPSADLAPEAPSADLAPEAPSADLAPEAPSADLAPEAPSADLAQEAPSADLASRSPSGEGAAPAQEAPASSTVIAGAANQEPRRKRAKKTTVESIDVDSYAAKNWRKLDFATATSAVTVTETQSLKTIFVDKSVETSLMSSAAREPTREIAEPTERTPQILSVSEINKGIRDLLEGRYSLLWLKGEISNFKAHTSGHFYFSLKDSKAQISAVMFRGFNSSLRFRPEDGMEVLVRGKITVYEPRGNYQIFCETMEPVGAGALQKAFEQLKAKLQREGLFDEARKRPLPVLPKHIAIVTSPTGAAIRDMLNVLGRRFKGARITVIPCKVQGEQAPGEIVHAIQLANRLLDVDVMIVGRGGGSIEDLWAFNDERVARALTTTRVPVISAVGHEIDFTIADFVADLRAPTPSAAAELVVKNAADLSLQVAGLARSLRMTVMRQLNQSQQNIVMLSRRLIDPQRRIEDATQRCDELIARLEAAALRGIETCGLHVQVLHRRMGTPTSKMALLRHRVQSFKAQLRNSASRNLMFKREVIARQMAMLDSLSPLRVLDRGYSMVTRGEHVITAANDLKPGDQVHVRMGQGSIDAEVKSVHSAESVQD